MTFKELVEQVAADSGVSRTEARQVLTSLATVVKANASKGEESPIPNLGSFTVKHRKARQGVKPGTSEAITITARDVLAFRVSPAARVVDSE